MAQAVSDRSLTAVVRVWYYARPCQFMTQIVALVQVFLRSVSTVPPMPQAHILFIYHASYVILAASSNKTPLSGTCDLHNSAVNLQEPMQGLWPNGSSLRRKSTST